MYTIYLISVGADSSYLLESSAKQLNGIQSEFRFSVVPISSDLGKNALAFQRERYLTTAVYDWFVTMRRTLGGRRDHVICFVNRPLSSPKLSNLFGSHRAEDGLAVVTLNDSEQYIRAEERFCTYFLVRYAMSFLNPSVRSHDDPGRNGCYFNRKIYKPEIRLSLESGRVCDECKTALEQPYGASQRKPSAEELDSLAAMRKEVSGELPRAIVMKGGGVKGLAFAGALLELEKYYWFDQHVGASAGAIAAVLLAAKYTPSELCEELRKTRFSDFKDARFWTIPFNLLFRHGMYPGERFRLWIAELLRRKLPKLSEVTMADLEGVVIYATRRGPGTLTFDSVDQRRDTVASFATRCSMSIPVLFTPEKVDGRRVYDGGLRNNFPLKMFLDSYPGKPYVGLYLGWPDSTNRSSMVKDFFEIFLDGEERQVVDANRASIVVIDPRPVTTVDFDLTVQEQDFLVAEGRACALEFLAERNFEDGPTLEIVAQARTHANELRKQVSRRRRKKQWLLRIIFVFVYALLCVVFYFQFYR